MKTLTEFSGFQVKAALQKEAELVKEGKAAEEIPAAIGEALKVEGDRLKWLGHAMAVAKDRTESLKRIVVLILDEKDKAPVHAEKREEHHYLPEFFPAISFERKGQGRGDGRGDRDRGKGKRGGRGGRGARGRDGGRGRDSGGGGRDGRPKEDAPARPAPPTPAK